MRLDAEKVYLRQLFDAKLIGLSLSELSSDTVADLRGIQSALSTVIVSVHSVVELPDRCDGKPDWGYVFEVRNNMSELLNGGVEMVMFNATPANRRNIARFFSERWILLMSLTMKGREVRPSCSSGQT